MKQTYILRGLVALVLAVLASSFTLEAPAMRFSPVGTWEYSVPGVQPCYEKGSMVIE